MVLRGLAAAGLLLGAFPTGAATAEDVEWQGAAAFEVEGKGWAATTGFFDRLPDSAKDKVSAVAWQQSRESAGLAVRVITDAAAVHVRWSLTSGSLAMPHMPATGCSGVDLYTRGTDRTWRFVGNGRPGKQEGNLATFEFPDGARPQRECLLYLPLYNGTLSLELGVKQGAHLEKAPPRPEARRQPIVIYGTSITQGGCASRPGMAWTAILGRLLDRPVINLGFSSAGTMSPPVGEVLAELDPAAYVIDCTWNMGDTQEVYFDHTTRLVHTLRKTHPLTPILFVGQSLIRPEAHPTDLSNRQEAAVRRLQMEGIAGLEMIPGTDLIGHDGEGTVDGVHLNDLGMERQARVLFPIVSKAVSGR
jgi:hypothetical protein